MKGGVAALEQDALGREVLFWQGDRAFLVERQGGAWAARIQEAIASEGALIPVAANLLGAGLLGVERSQRRELLARLETELMLATRRAFEVERAMGRLDDVARRLAGLGWTAFLAESSLRLGTSALLVRVFGERFLREARALSAGWRGWRFPPLVELSVEGLPMDGLQVEVSRESLAQWWLEGGW